MLPVFGPGYCIVSATFALAILAGGATISFKLAAYIALGGYLGTILYVHFLGLWPSFVILPEAAAGMAEKLIRSSKNLVEVSECTWAPASYTSWLWKSDRIALYKLNDGSDYRLTGRHRDICIIITRLAKISERLP